MSLHVSDVFSQFLPLYQQQHRLSAQQDSVSRHILQCRTPALGQQLWECDHCHQPQVVCCSCRDRHCPRCQGQRRRDWIESQAANLVNARYFHVVFTLPHELNVLSQYAPERLYGCLFQAVWQTLAKFASQHKRIPGQLGMTAVLHTWGQTLSQHIHLHCLIPGGLLSRSGQWRRIDKDYLFPVKALSTVFRAKMLAQLRENQLSVAESDKLMDKPWNVYSKACLCEPKTVVRYLARYTRQGMLHESRLQQMDSQTVSFSYRDYREPNLRKSLTLSGEEFIRRYLSHILPKGLMRIRHFGILANRCRQQKLALIRQQQIQSAVVENDKDEPREGQSEWHCPVCAKGVLRLVPLRLATRRPDN